MGYPASGVEATYRNSITSVAEMLNTIHRNKYLVINLSERPYDPTPLNNSVLDIGFPDHHAPPMQLIFKVMTSLHSWLSHPEHVVVIHCLAGRGRTGTITCCYLLYSGTFKHVDTALNYYAVKRSNSNQGVSQPSQRRYVYYFQQLLIGQPGTEGQYSDDESEEESSAHNNGDVSNNNSEGTDNSEGTNNGTQSTKSGGSNTEKQVGIPKPLYNPRPICVRLTSVVFSPIPTISSWGGIKPLLYIYNYSKNNEDVLYCSETKKEKVRYYTPEHKFMAFDTAGIELKGDIVVKLYHISTGLLLNPKREEVIRIVFNTGFINGSERCCVWGKKDLDKAFKDPRFPPNFTVQMNHDLIPNSNIDDVWSEDMYKQIYKTHQKNIRKVTPIDLNGLPLETHTSSQLFNNNATIVDDSIETQFEEILHTSSPEAQRTPSNSPTESLIDLKEDWIVVNQNDNVLSNSYSPTIQSFSLTENNETHVGGNDPLK